MSSADAAWDRAADRRQRAWDGSPFATAFALLIAPRHPAPTPFGGTS